MWSRHSWTSRVPLSPAKALELCGEEIPKLLMPLQISVVASVGMLSRYNNFHPTHLVAKEKFSPCMQFAMLRSGGQIRPIPWPSFCVDHLQKSGCQWSQPNWKWTFGWQDHDWHFILRFRVGFQSIWLPLMGCKFSILTTLSLVVIQFSTEMLQVVHKFSQAKFFAGSDIQCSSNVWISLHFYLKIGSGAPKPVWLPPTPTNELWFQCYVSGVLICSVNKNMVGLLHCEMCLDCLKPCWVMKGIVQLFLATFHIQQHCFCISFMLKEIWQGLMGQYLHFRDVMDRLTYIITSVVYLDRIRERAEYLANIFSKQNSQMTSIPLKCFGMPSSVLWSARDIGDYKGGQLVKNEALAVQVPLHQLQQTNGFSQIFCIKTFENEASEAMVKCEGCSEIRNRWLELFDVDVVVNGSVLAAGEELWPDDIFIQDQNTSTHGAVFWTDLRYISIRATNTTGCTFIFDPGGQVVIFSRVDKQLHITILPLQVDIRRNLSSVHRLEGKPCLSGGECQGLGRCIMGFQLGYEMGFCRDRGKRIKDARHTGRGSNRTGTVFYLPTSVQVPQPSAVLATYL